MLTEESKKRMEKQGYRIVGDHSAVKTCGWTKNMIKGKGGCYKLKFYGIMSHQCLQMTTSISCANRCSFCWRDYKAPVSKEWKWDVDDPAMILEQSEHFHHDLLVGFGGNEKANKTAFEQSKTVKHVALSLTGEPIMYPRINELLTLFNKQGVSTFLVTNAQYPEQIRDLAPVTQLYISLDAPNKELLKEVDKPLFKDYWERLLQSLDYLKEKKERTCIRLTLMKGINMIEPENYAELINRAEPDFLEVKSYMYVGASRERLEEKNMPLHEDVVEYTKELVKFLPEYEIVSEHIASRVIMLAKKTFKKNNVWETWIDFPKWHEFINSGKPFTVQDYTKRTPQVGLSGKGTKDYLPTHKKESFVKVNDDKEELSFYEEEKLSDDGC